MKQRAKNLKLLSRQRQWDAFPKDVQSAQKRPGSQKK